jgi:hypothetical protein
VPEEFEGKPPTVPTSLQQHQVDSTLSGVGSVLGQLSQHPGQSHFCVSSLEATLHRGLDLALGLGGTHALAEEIGIAAEVLGWRQRDRIDPVLDRELAGGWEPRDPMSERFDEVIERGGGQRSIDPAVPLSWPVKRKYATQPIAWQRGRARLFEK